MYREVVYREVLLYNDYQRQAFSHESNNTNCVWLEFQKLGWAKNEYYAIVKKMFISRDR